MNVIMLQAILVLLFISRVSTQTCPAGSVTQRHFDNTLYYNQRCDPVLCSFCPAGNYIDSGNNCVYCAAGNYSEFYGLTVCNMCTQGTYSGTGASTCTKCSWGTYNTNIGSSTCRFCSAGTYMANTNPTMCTACTAGTYSLGTSANCLICNAGTYSSLNGASECLMCSAGTYNSGTQASVCTTCSGGTFNSITGASTCDTCAAGTWSSPGATECRTCNGNYICSQIQYQQACQWCPENWYRSVSDLNGYCSTNPTAFVIGCKACSQVSDCGTGKYLNFQCTGTGYSNNACLTCTTTKCTDINKYRTSCTPTADSQCTNTYTQCDAGYYLAGFGISNDGTCTQCMDCLDPRNITVTCSQYVAQVCTGPCNTWAPCSAGVCIYNYNNRGNTICIECPTGYTRDNSLCRRPPTATRCNNGFYLNFADMTCKTCIRMVIGSVAITHGIYDNDAGTCLWETAPKGTGNKVGFYGTTACAGGMTAEANNADVPGDCKTCPATPPSNIISYQNGAACIWKCVDPYVMIGNTCYKQDESDICGDNGLMLNASKKCIFSPVPWQKRGHVYVADVYVIQGNPTNMPVSITYNPFTYNQGGYILTAIERTTYSNDDKNYLEVNYADISTVGLVCSAAVGSDSTIYIAFCNISMLFYMDNNDQSIYRLIGTNTVGYVEGMKNEARFNQELYIATSADPNRLIVLDTLNCVIREVIIGPNGAGDFRTQSFWVYGGTTCNILHQPRFLFTLTNNILAFVDNTNIIGQIHTTARKVSFLPRTLVYPVKSIGNTNDGYALVVFYTNGIIETFINQGSVCVLGYIAGVDCDAQLCPDDYTSYPGSSCTIYAPWNEGSFVDGFYIQDGFPRKCIQADCGWGATPLPCTRSSPSTCASCFPEVSFSYSLMAPNTCDYNMVPPCPASTYNDSGICYPCPYIMYTEFLNMNGYSSCICGEPLTKTGDTCVLATGTTFFPLYQQSVCDFAQMRDPYSQSCMNCIDTPCNIPNVGQYATTCYGALGTCIIPTNAYATSTGAVNDPYSCTWTCNAGYKKSGSICIACTDMPQIVIGYYYKDDLYECAWDVYLSVGT